MCITISVEFANVLFVYTIFLFLEGEFANVLFVYTISYF